MVYNLRTLSIMVSSNVVVDDGIAVDSHDNSDDDLPNDFFIQQVEERNDELMMLEKMKTWKRLSQTKRNIYN